jgi:cell division transport system permease protein
LTGYLLRHLQVLFYTAGQLAASPFASLLTVAVIGITLALPSALYVALDNIQRVTSGWEGGAQISLFLKDDVRDEPARQLATTIGEMPEVDRVKYISPEAAYDEFKRLSGFGASLQALENNPLPGVLIVHPHARHSDPRTLTSLLERLRDNGAVEMAQLDLQWVKRLHAILELAQRGVLILAVLLGIAVLLIISNTIRLAVLNRKEEIQITQLIGGTDAFIRRPFLYSGFLQGLLGGLTSWLLVESSMAMVSGPIAELANLYGSNFHISGMDYQASLVLLAGGGLLGWLASRLAVSRHLDAMEPT